MATELAKNVFEKQWPLPGNLVRPLERYEGESPQAEEEREGGPGDAADRFEDPGGDVQSEPEVNPGDLLPIPEPDFGDEPLPDFEAEGEEEEPF